LNLASGIGRLIDASASAFVVTVVTPTGAAGLLLMS